MIKNTTYGVKENGLMQTLVKKNLTMDILFT